MKKNPLKLIASFTTAIFTFFTFGAVANAAIFSDVPDDHEYFKAIEYLKSKSYINGYQDMTFKPENTITRAEVAKIVVSALGVKTNNTFTETFVDVSASEWYFPYVMAAQNSNIITGDKAGTFRPNDTISMAEALAILCRSYKVGVPTLDASSDAPFADVEPTDWYAGYAQFAKEKSIAMMDDYGNIGINVKLNRGRFADLMYRFLIVKDSGWKEYPFYETWKTYDSNVLPFEVKYPNNWQIIKYTFDGGEGVSFWKSDQGYFQSFPERVYPNTAKFVVALDVNSQGLTQSQYFSNIKKIFTNAKFSEVKVGDFTALQVAYPEDYIVDRYLYLTKGDFDKQVLTIYTQNGDGILSDQNRKFLDALLNTFEYKNVKVSTTDYTKIKSNIYKNILVEGEGKDLIDSMPDKVIIMTDAIGVGTGPIDYYYSSALEMTLKYERAGDVVLDYRDSQTTAF